MKSTYETMGGKYQQNDDYLLPNFEVPECPKVGVWGERRRKYLREHQQALYNAMFNLCCRLCSTYERKAFIDGVQYGAHLIRELEE